MEEATLRHILHLQVQSIKDEELRTIVETVLEHLPDAFWKRESSKKYHPVDERGINGNLIHSLKVAKLADRILDTGKKDQYKRDLVKSASILHDSLRHGPSGTSQWSAKDHPQLVRQFMEEECNLEGPTVDRLCSVIEHHMGQWGNPVHYTNIDDYDVLHLADFLVTQLDIEVKI